MKADQRTEKDLTAKQRRVLDLMLTTEKTQKQIAAEVGITEMSVSRIKKDPAFQAAYRNAIEQGLSRSAAKAFRTMTQLLDSEQDQVRLQAAKDLMDRTGYKPPKDIKIDLVEDAKTQLAGIIDQLK